MQVTKATITPLEDGSFAVDCEHTTQPGSPTVPLEPEIYDTLDEALEYLRSKMDGGTEEKPMIDGEEEFLAGFKGASGDQGY